LLAFLLVPPEKTESVAFPVRLQQREGTIDVRGIRLAPAKPAGAADTAKNS
jgi:hypothetical protein